jgi:hypothetical protein
MGDVEKRERTRSFSADRRTVPGFSVLVVSRSRMEPWLGADSVTLGLALVGFTRVYAAVWIWQVLLLRGVLTSHKKAKGLTLCSASTSLPSSSCTLPQLPNVEKLQKPLSDSRISFSLVCDLIQVMENLPTQLAHLQRGNRRQSVAPPSLAQWEGVKETVRRIYIERMDGKKMICEIS